jgi:hypothetical protein
LVRSANSPWSREWRVFKITGLDKLQKELDDASKAFKALDGELTTLRYNPEEPSSVEAAVRQVEEARIRRWRRASPPSRMWSGRSRLGCRASAPRKFRQ